MICQHCGNPFGAKHRRRCAERIRKANAAALRNCARAVAQHKEEQQGNEVRLGYVIDWWHIADSTMTIVVSTDPYEVGQASR